MGAVGHPVGIGLRLPDRLTDHADGGVRHGGRLEFKDPRSLVLTAVGLYAVFVHHPFPAVGLQGIGSRNRDNKRKPQDQNRRTAF